MNSCLACKKAMIYIDPSGYRKAEALQCNSLKKPCSEVTMEECLNIKEMANEFNV